METIVTREGKKRPPRGYNTPEKEYAKALYQVLVFFKILIIDPRSVWPIENAFYTILYAAILELYY